MLDQKTSASAFRLHLRTQFPGSVELMIARKNDAADLLLLVALGNHVAADHFKPAIALPHFLPKITCGMARTVGGISRTPVAAPIEGQEARCSTFQFRRHHHIAVADSEMDQGTRCKGQKRLTARIAIELILVDCIADGLGEIGLELSSGDRDPIEKRPRSMQFSFDFE